MKKKFLSLLGIACFSLIIGVSGCNNKTNPSDGGGDVEPIQKTWTVAFEVDGARYQTLKVKDGEHITQTVANPTKEGYVFSGWYEGTELVDLAEYVVTKNVTFVAHFDEDTGPVLSVDDVKETGKTYYLVFGWWEVNDPDDPTKVTSYLTRDTVRLFYGNMIKYLKLKTPAATDAEIANIQFRNYSSAKVADMGAAINADGDVDIIIGVGPNIKTGGGVDYYDRFQTPMGTKPETRYVVAPTVATALGKETFNWLKDTDAGKAAFLRELTDAEIEASFAPEEINLAVTVHDGDTNVTTTLTDKDTSVTMPTFTPPDGKRFAGFALTEDGEVVLTSTDLKYDDLKDLVAEGATTLDLYVIYEDIPVVAEDLIVYIQLNSGLKEVEAKLLEARFNETVTDKNIRFETVSGNATAFTTAVNEAGNVDVAIGGGNPINSHTAHEQGPAATAGAKHFADSSRRICIESTVHPDHLALAKTFYDFVVAEAPQFELHVAFWTKNGDWVTETEENQLKDNIQAQVKNYMDVTTEETLLDKYNIVITFVDVAGTKVANLGADTLALRDGKGTDLLIGCGDNVTTTGGVTVIEKKVIPTTIVAAERQVALVREHFLARNVYEAVFASVEAQTE